MDEGQDADQRSFQRSYSQQQAARIKTKFKTQANALLRKNGMQQRRSWVGSLVVVLMPILFCALLFVLQKVINNAINTPDNRCGCYCNLCYKTVNGIEQAFNSSSPENACQPFEQCTTYNESLCGLEYSSSSQAAFCPITTPSTWPALIQAPPINLTDGTVDLATLNSTALFTGADRAVAEVLAASLFFVPNVTAEDEAAATASLVAGYAAGAVNASALSQLGLVMGTTELGEDFYSLQLEPAFVNSEDYNASILNAVSSAANPNSVDSTAVLEGYLNRSTILGLAAPSVNLFTVVSQYAANASDIQDQAYCAYRDSRCAGTPAVQAWDFQDTSQTKLNLLMFYNGTSRAEEGPPAILRVNQGINRATNAFLRYALGGEEYQAWLLGLQEMPKGGSRLSIDFSSLLGPLFFCWLLQLLLPSMLNQLVYEKERRLRSIMKMHGLGDAAYWTIQYTWFFLLNFVFSWILILFGSLINLSFFRRTSYSFQFVFYWLWVNCLVSFAFLLSTLFKSAKTAVVVGFLYVFGTGLVGVLLLQTFISEAYWWVIFLELVPGWALYRGLYEIAQYAFRGNAQDRQGMSWSSLGDTNNGVPAVMAIMAVETVVFMVIAWYLEQVVDTGVGVRRHPLFFLGRFRKDKPVKQHAKVVDGGGGADEAVTVGVEAEDVRAERQRVEGLSPGASHEASIVIRDLHKTFPAPFGGIGKQAVRGLTLAIQRGECFGLLGPNGAGKSTTLNMLTGFLDPTHGTALIEGHDIRREMNTIYSLMGVCPQDNLLWERLTAREHLTFYGRLKNLRGQQLTTAVNDALRKVNLLNGGVGDKQVRRYSGGMKRRLSVAISFIGSPLVVYLDEPSTGLDPASRQNLWSVVKAAKEERAIILTTHSMEEATVLCDRLGIFVDGTLVCIGNPKELTSRYGGYLVFTITTPLEQEAAAHALVTRMSPGARLTYALAGTRKYELPVQEVTLPGVFETMEAAKAELRVLDWGVANATLEEVFIKFAKSLGVAGG